MSVTAFQGARWPKKVFRKICQITKTAFCALLLAASTGQADTYGHWSHYLSDSPPAPAQPHRARTLTAALDPGPLRSAMEQCQAPVRSNDFSIAHRGAPALFPEHTRESYIAAARQGAGIIECDVTFTKDGELVCRHSQCDLHRTTNILDTPLRQHCRTPFNAASNEQPATVECCTSDLTLAQFRSLCGKHDNADSSARTRQGYMHGGAARAYEQYPGCGTLMTLADSITLIQSLDRKHAPELKAADDALPYSKSQYAQMLIDQYRAQNIAPDAVFPQSFDPQDIRYWLQAEPAFGRQAVLLDSRDAVMDAANPTDPGLIGSGPTFTQLRAMGLRYLAPPMWFLLRTEQGQMVPSTYAQQARAAGLKLIAWTLERSGPIQDLIKYRDGRAYYYQSVLEALRDEGDVLRTLAVLAHDVGVVGVFSDWPETTTVFANCALDAPAVTE